MFNWLEEVPLLLLSSVHYNFFDLGLHAVRHFQNQTVTQGTLHLESFNIALTFIFHRLIILSAEVEN